jgi:perosamine synthetase
VHSVTWRRQPPVLSRVSSRALVGGLGATLGLGASAHEVVSAALRERYGCRDALLTDSGTAALILALGKLAPAGGTVALPAYGCIDLTTAALGVGLRVRLYDIDPATLSPDLDSVRAVIKRGVDTIVVTHLYGYPADMIGVKALAAEEGTSVIEDAAQGAGGSLCGALLGSIGDVSVLSFARGKGMTGGSGGALLVRTPALAQWTSRARLGLQAGSRGGKAVLSLAVQRLLSHPNLYRLPASIPALKLGEMIYHPPRIPRAMSAASASVLRWSLADDVRQLAARRACAGELLSLVRDTPGVSAVRPLTGGESGFLRFALIDKRGTLVPRADLGAVRGYPLTLEQHPQLRPLLLPGEIAGTGAQLLRDRLFTVPTHYRVDARDLTRLAEWFRGSAAESSSPASSP